MSGCEGCANRRAGEPLTVRIVQENAPAPLWLKLATAGVMGALIYTTLRAPRSVPV